MKNKLNSTTYSDGILASWSGTFKSIGDEGVLEGDAILFGSENEPDRSPLKDFFTADTFIHPEEEFTTALYLEHGLGYKKPIGKATMKKYDKGWKATAQLDMTNDVVKSKFPEIKAGGFGFSTGAVGHVVLRESRANDTHFITQWSVGELSVTATPAEKRALIHNVKSLNDWYGEDTADVTNTNSSHCMLDDEETHEVSEMDTIHEKLMKIIEMLISELTKKNVEQFLNPHLEEIKTQLSEIKSASLPIGIGKTSEEDSVDPNKADHMDDDADSNEKLTVLKSENEELKSSLEELQSSLMEKEALLSEKMVLLSEMEKEQVDLKQKLEDAEKKIESMMEQYDQQKRTNLALAKSNFNFNK